LAESGAGGAGGEVKVKAIGYLTRHLPGGGPVSVPVPPGGSVTAGEAMRLAGIPDEQVFVIISGGKRVKPDHELRAGDEVTFVPPVAGG